MRTRILLALAVLLSLAAACQRGPDAPEVVYSPPDLARLQTRTFEAMWSTIHENYVYEDFHGRDWTAIGDSYRAQLTAEMPSDSFWTLLREMSAELSPDIVLQTRGERVQEALTDPSRYDGIGTFVSVRSAPEARIILMDVMQGSPAEAAGLMAHDAIVGIDGVAVGEHPAESVVDSIRGAAGSDVLLTIRSPGGAPRDVTVTRGSVPAAQVAIESKLLDDAAVAYFLFPPVSYNTLLDDFLFGLQTLAEEGDLSGMILDLRTVSAGNSWPTGQLLSMFIDGQVGTAYARGESSPLIVPSLEVVPPELEMPMAILVGKETAGSAEILAAALQNERRATVLGSTTPGEVESVSSFILPDGSQVIVPTTSFRTAAGYEVGLFGVEPDIAVEGDWDNVTEEVDPVRDAALAELHAQRS